MSEENDKEKKGKGLKIVLDRTPEMEKLEQERDELKAQLKLVAMREFDKQVMEYSERAEKVGVDVGYIENPEQLKYLKKQVEDAEGSRVIKQSTPLQFYEEGNERSGDLREWEVENLTEVVDVINKAYEQKEDPKLRKQAMKIMFEALKKAQEQVRKKEDTTMYYSGEISKIAQLEQLVNPKSTALGTGVTLDPESRAKVLELIKKEKAKWSKKEKKGN